MDVREPPRLFLCRYCEQGYVRDPLLWCRGCEELAKLVDEVRAASA